MTSCMSLSGVSVSIISGQEYMVTLTNKTDGKVGWEIRSFPRKVSSFYQSMDAQYQKRGKLSRI